MRCRTTVCGLAGITLAAAACSGGQTPVTIVDPPSAGSAHLRMISGDGQVGMVNTQLPKPYVVQLLDSLGHPVVSASVRGRTLGKWSGTVDSLVHTDTLGFARLQRYLGSQTGIQQTLVRSSAAPADTVLFTDSVRSAAASRRR